VGTEDGQDRFAAAGNDDAALHRRDHDKAMTDAASPMSKDMCSRNISRRPRPLRQRFRVQDRRHIDHVAFRDTGDFNSAYTVKSTSHSEGGPSGAPRDTTTTIEAKWLGPASRSEAGDIVMPGGFKMNVKDAQKLKGLLPK